MLKREDAPTEKSLEEKLAEANRRIAELEARERLRELQDEAKAREVSDRPDYVDTKNRSVTIDGEGHTINVYISEAEAQTIDFPRTEV